MVRETGPAVRINRKRPAARRGAEAAERVALSGPVMNPVGWIAFVILRERRA